MLGGGFLKQMAETNKYNRDLLGKTKRKPFDKSDYKEGDGKTILTNGTGLTDSDRKELFHQMSLDAQRQRRKQFLALIISLVVTIIIAYLINWIYL
jgi:hypothetical protein